MESYKTATVQFQHAPGNKVANLEIIAAYVDEARKSGVWLIAFPEMCITGYWHVRNLSKEDIQVLAEPVPDGPSTQKLVDLATKYKMTIGAGLIEVDENGLLYNTYVVALSDAQSTSIENCIHLSAPIWKVVTPTPCSIPQRGYGLGYSSATTTTSLRMLV